MAGSGWPKLPETGAKSAEAAGDAGTGGIVDGTELKPALEATSGWVNCPDTDAKPVVTGGVTGAGAKVTGTTGA